jgi:hypothetical protein
MISPDGSQATGTLTPLEVPAYGDRSVAARAVIDLGGGNVLTQDLVLVTIGQVQAAFGVGGLEAADAESLDAIVAGILGKLPPAV